MSTNTKKKAVEAVKTVMYVGPTIQGVVRKNTVFNNGLPKAFVELQASIPIISNLVIEIDDVAKARRESENPASVLSVAYRKVLELTGGRA